MHRGEKHRAPLCRMFGGSRRRMSKILSGAQPHYNPCIPPAALHRPILTRTRFASHMDMLYCTRLNFLRVKAYNWIKTMNGDWLIWSSAFFFFSCQLVRSGSYSFPAQYLASHCNSCSVCIFEVIQSGGCVIKIFRHKAKKTCCIELQVNKCGKPWLSWPFGSLSFLWISSRMDRCWVSLF